MVMARTDCMIPRVLHALRDLLRDLGELLEKGHGGKWTTTNAKDSGGGKDGGGKRGAVARRKGNGVRVTDAGDLISPGSTAQPRRHTTYISSTWLDPQCKLERIEGDLGLEWKMGVNG